MWFTLTAAQKKQKKTKNISQPGSAALTENLNKDVTALKTIYFQKIIHLVKECIYDS